MRATRPALFRATQAVLAMTRMPAGGFRANVFRQKVRRSELDDAFETHGIDFATTHADNTYANSFLARMRGWVAMDMQLLPWLVIFMPIAYVLLTVSYLWPEYFVGMPFPFQPFYLQSPADNVNMTSSGHGAYNFSAIKGNADPFGSLASDVLQPHQTMLRFERFENARVRRAAELSELDAELAGFREKAGVAVRAC
eukprot:TRINITY_DN3115_c0_g1_i1.p1 TRINITY_DN3115_c0_g1~~TRINITY_DN3115_c0_g1_i1.p1  ORF type:complete len:197 (+),score=49.36 TRINITY_DN3115_c0_g1_i1:84-674(+)